MKKCDQDFMKKAKIRKIKKFTMRRKWVKKNLFNWKEFQQKIFEKMKQAIIDNVMINVDFKF